ncbi:MAG: hypothetical protein IJP78_02975 [Clostridia bacterium]|nr:hypothetical protein [Clostridia bacterium]
MKRTYETPSVEKLDFNYTDVVAASKTPTGETIIEMTNVDQNINYCLVCSGTGGYAFEDNHTCHKDPDRSKNKKCY